MEQPTIVPYMVLQNECQRQHDGKSTAVQTIQCIYMHNANFIICGWHRSPFEVTVLVSE